MIRLPGHLQRELLRGLHELEDMAKELVRKIGDEIGPGIREEIQGVNARGEAYFSAIYDLIYLDTSEGNETAESIRKMRRRFDEIVLKQVEFERFLRDGRLRAQEEEDSRQVDRATRDAQEQADSNRSERLRREMNIEIARLDAKPE